MTDREVEQRLGYTPRVCGVIDGTWHPACYVNQTKEQIEAGYKRAFANARRHLKRASMTPNVADKRHGTVLRDGSA